MRELRVWVIARLGNAALSDITAVQIQYGASALPKGLRLIGKLTRFRLPTVCIIDSLSG